MLIRSIAICLFGACLWTGVFAESCVKGDLPSGDELRSAVESCLKERKPGGNPNSITEFVCPQGDFSKENNQAYNDEVVAYLVAVNIAFNKADKDITEYMKKLRQSREKNPTRWIEDIRKCVNGIGDGDTGSGVEQIYNNICGFGVLEARLNDGEKKYIRTTNTYPQALCRARAAQKIQGWVNLGYISMSDGINKSQKNDTDKWITSVKGSYTRVIRLWHDYQKILGRAVSKMTGYNRQSN